MYSKIEACRICGNRELVEVLDLGTQALTGVFPKTRGQAITSGPLKLVKCFGSPDACGLLQLQHTYDLNEMYGLDYGYRSGLNASMVAHLRAKVAKILGRKKLEGNPLVIDVGSNDSTTLQAYPKQGCTLVGIDPTGTKFRSLYPPHIQLLPEFFSSATVRKHFGTRRAAVITSFSMFYDLEEPLKFMREICEVLDDEGIWVFEQSYMPTMLAQNSYDTVCHEHLEYYALKQIKWMADKVGLKLLDVEFNDVNGGSFSVTAAKQGSSHVASSSVSKAFDAEAKLDLDRLRVYREFASRVADSRRALQEFLDRAKVSGKTVVALGASTKGNVILQYCGVTAGQVASVGEVNQDKYGCFTPGTLLPIGREDELLASNPDYLLVLPWHFRKFFTDNQRFAGRKLVFPLPILEVV
jgi:hypothetical protein